MPDAGPHILDLTPLEVRNALFDHFDVRFSAAIDSTSFTPADVAIIGPVGGVTPTAVEQLGADLFRVEFTPLAERGSYRVSVGPDITDLTGQRMDQNQNGISGETTADRYTTSLTYIDANTIISSPLTIHEGDTSVDGRDILIDGTSVAIDGAHSFHSIHLVNGAVLTHSADTATQTHKLDLSVTQQVIVDVSSRIDVTGKGYAAGRTTGNTTVGGATGAGGGSYGGAGGSSGGASVVYGDYASPDDWGSGGGTVTAAAGGGLVRITAQALTLDGAILADGNGNGSAAGAAGGGVYVAVGSLSGGGGIRAAGGTDDTDYNGSGGGGGRVAVYAADFGNFRLAAVTAPGGDGDRSGGAGTVYLRDTDEADGTLVIDGGSGRGPGGLTPLGLPGQATFTVPDRVVIRGPYTSVRPEHDGLALDFQKAVDVRDRATLYVPGDLRLGATAAVTVTGNALLSVGGSVTVDGSLLAGSQGHIIVTGSVTSNHALTVAGGTLEVSQIVAPALSIIGGALLTSLTSTATRMYGLDLQVVGTLTVDASSRIDVSGKGYLPGRTTGNTTSGGATGVSAGSYGGQGGVSRDSTNATYGDYADPEDWGSGGIAGSGSPGGGLVRITAGTLALDGLLLADGYSSHYGGSGGSVFVSVDILRGGGAIRAAGGAGESDFSYGGATDGGGGGRVAVYARDFGIFDATRITAPGGRTAGGGYGSAPGGAGSVYLVQGLPHTHVRSALPMGLNGGHLNSSINSVTLTFNKAIDTSTFGPDSFVVDGQMGHAQASGITLVGDRTYRIDLPFTLTENGPYHFTLSQAVRDLEGNPLDQNANGIPGEAEDGYSFTLIVDTVPPRVTSHVPAGDIAGTVDLVDVWFSEVIDKATFTASDVVITRPDGQTIPVNGIAEVGLNRFRISFAAQTLAGQYHVRVGPDVRDLAGNQLDQDRDGVAGEPGQDVYDASFNVVPVDLGLNGLVVGASQLVAGDAVTISWQGQNRTGAELLGDWIDAVYLSTDDRWDISDTRLATVPHTGGLAAGQTYSGSATVFIPGVLPGNYRILVRADVGNQERETNEANNQIASPPLPLLVHELSGRSLPASGVLTATDRADYYALHVAGGENVGLVLTGHATNGTNELYASFESIPTRLSADYRAVGDQTETNGQNRNLAFTAPPGGGTFYVLIYGADVNGSTPYDLTASTGSFVVTTITPDRGTNRPPDLDGFNRPSVGRVVPTTVTVNGAGFDASTTVRFMGSDGTARAPAATHLVSSSVLTLDLDVTTWSAGVYDVRIAKGATTFTRPAAFTVVAGGTAHLETRIIAPAVMGFHVQTPQIVWVEYRNTGSAPMPAPLLTLSADMEARLTADPSVAYPTPLYENLPASVTGTVQLIAAGSGGTPGILQPGDSGRIPVYYLGRGVFPTHSMTFTLSNVTADDVSWSNTVSSTHVEIRNGIRYLVTSSTTTGENWHVNWAASAKRPESVPQDAWAAVTTNLNAQIGTEWGNYVEAMADDLNFLSTVGQKTNDVGQIWNFEVAQASAGLGPVKTLAASVDASAPTPGLPLTFSRVFGESIISRYALGSLGRGWSTNWDVRAETQGNGDVVLRGPGGVDRFFTLGHGGFTGATGDHGLLTLVGGVYRLTETDGTVWQFRTDGKLDFVQDTNANRITLAYTGNNLTSLTHSSGRQLLLEYNAAGRLVRLTDPQGPGTADDRVTTYDYDASGEHLVRVTAPGNRVTGYTYDTGTALPKKHALTSVTFADNTHSFFAYDERGRLAETSADGGIGRLRYAYDSAGGVTVTDATDRVTYLAYGLNGRLEQVRDGASRTVDLTNCSCGQVTQIVGPGGEKYAYTHDANGNLTAVVDPLRQTTSFTYEPLFNRLVSVTDARGNGMSYGYDTRGNLTSITYADGTHENYTFDARGDVLTATNRRNQTTAYTYNAAGQVLTKDYLTTPGFTDFVYTYDTAGNLSTARDTTGTTTMTYEPGTDRLTSISYPGGHSFAFTYDAAGRRTSRTDETGNVENYAYDAAGRLDRMTDGAGALIVDYAYDPAGRLSKKTLGNGVYTTYGYDAAGNVLHLVNFEPDGRVLSRYDYTYDTSGRRTSMTTLEGTFTYGYDPLGQLTSVTNPDGRVMTYDYDAAGNRRAVADDSLVTQYTTNNLNQYTAAGGATYDYDPDGNMIAKTTGGVTTRYTYDLENRLTGVTTPTDTWTYRYDAFGSRVGATHNGATTNYVIDPTGLGNVAAEYDGSGQLLARYDHGYGLVDRTDGSGTAAFYTFSAIGNTSELTGASGGVLNSYAYDPFGVSMGKIETVTNPFEYVGEYGVMNEGNGLEFMRVRFYSAEVGRFLQNDPAGMIDGPNHYSYALNSPVNAIDPLGLWCIDAGFSIATGPLFGPSLDIGVVVDPKGIRIRYGAGVGIGGGGTIVVFPDGDASTGVGGSVTSSIPLYGPLGPAASYSTGGGCSGFGAGIGFGGGITVGTSWVSPPIFPFGHQISSSSTTVQAFDPNDKVGPGGYGAAGFILPDGSLAYQVRFENEADATAPAREIVVTDTLDPSLDLNTFELSEIAFADQSITVPPGLDHYETTLPIKANGTDLLVSVQATLDRTTRTFTLRLQAIDPTTGWFPEDPLLGLLYPNDATGRGVGSVSYRVSPKAGLPSGTVIQNRATIFFDFNDPIDTPLVHNTLDAAAPTSRVANLPPTTTGTTLELHWSGADDAGGSGVATFDILASVDGGNYITLFDHTTATSGSVVVEPGHTYAFYSVATDNVGHVEAAPAMPDAQIRVDGSNRPPVLSAIGDRTAPEGQPLTFTASATDPDAGDTLTFSLIGAPTSATIDSTTGVFSWTPTEAQGPGVFTFTVHVTDSGTPVLSDQETITVTVAEVNRTPVLAAIGNRAVDEGTALSFTAGATDPDFPVNALRFTLIGAPAGASIDPVTGAFAWTPTEAQGPGVFTFTVRVTDDGTPALFAEATITVTVREVNQAPVLAPIANPVVNEGTVLTFAAAATDPDLPAQRLTYTLVNAPIGAAIDPVTGVFTWTPDDGPGTATITVLVTDNGPGALTAARTVTVTVVNVAPTGSLTGPATVTVGSAAAFNFTGQTDPSAADRAAGFRYSFDFNNDGVFEVVNAATPTRSFAYAAAGTYVARGRITDKDGGSRDYTVTVVVVRPAPRLSEVRVGWGSQSEALTANTILPWTTIDRISVRFDSAVSVRKEDLTLTGVNVAHYTFAGFRYDPVTFTATWLLAAPLGIDRLTLRLDGDGPAGDGIDGVHGPAGTYLSGGDYAIAFGVLPGDVNRDGKVNWADLVLAGEASLLWLLRGVYFAPADTDGDGRIDLRDLGYVVRRLGTRLP